MPRQLAMSWHALPTELHLAIVALLAHHDVRALAATSAAARVLSLPAIFANVSLPSAASLSAFASHVPPSYGQYVRSLHIATLGSTGATLHILAILASCSRLHSLSLSLASSIAADLLVPAFSRLAHVQSLHISCGAREETTPVSERFVVALAASLPSLSHLTLSRITRSAIHVDPCDVPYGVPIVTNDFDVPPHPVLGSDLALPNLLRLPTLHTLEIRDTWLGCDAKIDVVASSSLEKLVLTGSMYSTGGTHNEAQACTSWLHACPSLRSCEIGAALAPLEPEQTPSVLPRALHVHVNASRIPVDDLSSTLDALKQCGVESISIAYEPQEREAKITPGDDFAHECAVDDLQDWSEAIDAFLLGRSKEEWSTLSRVDISFAPDVHASWDF